jgi:hypothetical protein
LISPWFAKNSIVKTFHARENTHVYVNKKPETFPNPQIKTEKRINCREKLSLVARVQPAVSHATFNSSSIVHITRDDLVQKKNNNALALCSSNLGQSGAAGRCSSMASQVLAAATSSAATSSAGASRPLPWCSADAQADFRSNR